MNELFKDLIDEYIYIHNNTKQSSTGYKPVDIRNLTDKFLIDKINN